MQRQGALGVQQPKPKPKSCYGMPGNAAQSRRRCFYSAAQNANGDRYKWRQLWS